MKSNIKLFLGFLFAFCMSVLLQACAGSPVQIEQLSYMLPNGQVASCVEHPDPNKPDWLQCTYGEGVNSVTVGVERQKTRLLNR